MKRIKITPAARLDLDAIWNYSENEWGVTTAEAYIIDVETAANSLTKTTEASVDASYIRPGYRKLLVRKHVLFSYETKADIVIVRILHQAQDVDINLL